MKNDHRSEFSNLSNWKKKPEKEKKKKNQGFNGIRNRDLLLHSSVGRATHRQRGGHGFESRWSPDFFFFFFFQASSFQLLKLEKIHCDDHSSLSSITAVQNELFHLFHISLICSNLFSYETLLYVYNGLQVFPSKGNISGVNTRWHGDSNTDLQQHFAMMKY